MHPLAIGAFIWVSIACAIHIWTLDDVRLRTKCFWLAVVFIPFFGPVFYGAFYKIPKPDRNKKHWPEDTGGIPGGLITL